MALMHLGYSVFGRCLRFICIVSVINEVHMRECVLLTGMSEQSKWGSVLAAWHACCAHAEDSQVSSAACGLYISITRPVSDWCHCHFINTMCACCSCLFESIYLFIMWLS